jgi:hypothetical protein
MQYHSLSLASLPNTHVDVIGYKESEPHPELVNNPNISIVPVSFFSFLNYFIFVLFLNIMI